MEAIRPYIPFLIPILLLQIGLMAFALIDLLRRADKEINGPKWAWAFIVILVNIIGPIAYFLIGRREV
jgi:hypothetical protein